MDINPSEVTKILKEQIKKFGDKAEVTEVGQVLSVGDGIARVKGFVLFIANTNKGDLVKVKVTKVLKNAGFAEVVEKLEKLTNPPTQQRRRKKFVTINPNEVQEEYKPKEHYEDTEDFGSDLEED